MAREVSKKHFTDWMVKAREKRIKWNIPETDKEKNHKNMERACLPVYDALFNIHYNDFHLDNQKLKEFLDKYNQFFVRAIPDKEHTHLPKRPLVGGQDWNEIKQFVDKIVKSNEKHYFVDILEHADDRGGGVIISRQNNLDAELLLKKEGGLAELCYSEETPTLSLRANLEKYGSLQSRIMYWGDEKNTETKNLLHHSLDFLRMGGNKFHPVFMKGYFEFLIRGDKKGKDSIVFFEWSQDENYMQ